MDTIQTEQNITSHEILATKANIAHLEDKLESNIKALDTKLTMFMWFITVGVTLFEIIHCFVSVAGK